MAFSTKPWPQTPVLHEIESLKDFLAQYEGLPQEIKHRNLEGAFERPMIYLSVVQSSINNFSQFSFEQQRIINLTWFGSEDISETDRVDESLVVHDILGEIFERGEHRGPLIPIRDYSTDPPTNTNDWIMVTEATVERAPDQYGLWTVPVNLRYSVRRDEARPVEIGIPITAIKKRVEIQ